MITFITSRPIRRWNGSLIRDAEPTTSSSMSQTLQETHQLPVDVLETADSYIVTASMPGVGPDDVEILLEDNQLNIGANVPAANAADGFAWLVRQRPFGRMGCSLRMPKPVDPGNCTTELSHGVLTVVLPKEQTVKARRLEINSGDRPAIEGTSRDITDK